MKTVHDTSLSLFLAHCNPLNSSIRIECLRGPPGPSTYPMSNYCVLGTMRNRDRGDREKQS